jgi:hypothetical protein
MAKHLPANTMAHVPAPRVIHYIDPAIRPAADPTSHGGTPAALRRAEQRELYARWVARQAAIAEHDRKVRRFWLGFGAIVGVAVLAAVAGLGWLACHAFATAEIGLPAVALLILVLAGLVVGGRRCIMIVQHWH